MDIAILNPEGSIYLIKWIHLILVIFWISHTVSYNFYFNHVLNSLNQDHLVNAIKLVFPRTRTFLLVTSLSSIATGVYLISYRVHQFGQEALLSSWGICISITLITAILMAINDFFITQKTYKKLISFTNSSQEFNIDHNFLMSLINKISNTQRINYMYMIMALFFALASNNLQFSVANRSFGIILTLVVLILVVIQSLPKFKINIGSLNLARINIASFSLTLLIYIIVEVFI